MQLTEFSTFITDEGRLSSLSTSYHG